MRLPTILTTAAVLAGFVPFGQAVCPDGDIAIVFLPPHWSIRANDCGRITSGTSTAMCGQQGDAYVNCDGANPVSVQLAEGSNWGPCYFTLGEGCYDPYSVWACCPRKA